MSKLIKKISSLSNNKDVKTLAGNFIWLSALQVASFAFPLITMPYIARVIGVEGYGKIAFAAALMLWVQIFSEWGFNQSATRDVAQYRDNPHKVSEIFSNVLWARLLLMFVSFVIIVGLIIIVPKLRADWDIILVTFLYVPAHILFPDWFFQAIEKMRYISLLNILMKLIFTIAVFIFIKAPEDYIIQPLLTSLGYVFSGAIALYFILHKWGVKIYRPNISVVLKTIKGSTDIFISNIAPNLYNSFSQILLGIVGGATASGIYEGGNKLYNISSNLLHIITRTFFPFLSRRPNQHKIFVLITMSITIVCSSMLFVFAPWIVTNVLSSEFVNSALVLKGLSISLIFTMLYNCYGMCYLIIHKREKVLRRITIYVSLFGFLISFILINKYSYLGAVATIVICRALLGVITFYAAKRVKISNTIW